MNIGEYINSRAWRQRHLYTIQDKDAQLVAYTPNWAQRSLFNEAHTRNNVLKARQMGLSTGIAIDGCDHATFNARQNCGIIDWSLPDGKKKLAMVARAYEHLDNGDLHPLTWRLGQLIKKKNPLTVGKEYLEWANGSNMTVSTSFRGGTLQWLHVSEKGKLAFRHPNKALEIHQGAFNAVPMNGRIYDESTHEGGQIGPHYDHLQRSIKIDPNNLTEKSFKFHFYPWWKDPGYILNKPEIPIRKCSVDYFERLRTAHNIQLPRSRMLWYDQTWLEQGFAMKKEYPSVPGEAFEALVEGSIYGTLLADVRAQNRLKDFNPDPVAPILTSWDIGDSDTTVLWLFQKVGNQFYILDWYENNNVHSSHYVQKIERWQNEYARPIAHNFLPHDARNTSKGTAATYLNILLEAGLPQDRLTIVPRVAHVWTGINHVYRRLPNCIFHRTGTDTRREIDEENSAPSGFACLEAYRKRAIKTGDAVAEAPLHDEHSHSADAFRTFCEADELGLIDAARDRRPILVDATGTPVNRRKKTTSNHWSPSR